MPGGLPFPVDARPWTELAEAERSFLCLEEDEDILHANLAAQIELLTPADSLRAAAWAGAKIPPAWPERSERRFREEESLLVRHAWNDAAGRAEVRAWLHGRGVPFRRTVY